MPRGDSTDRSKEWSARKLFAHCLCGSVRFHLRCVSKMVQIDQCPRARALHSSASVVSVPANVVIDGIEHTRAFKFEGEGEETVSCTICNSTLLQRSSTAKDGTDPVMVSLACVQRSGPDDWLSREIASEVATALAHVVHAEAGAPWFYPRLKNDDGREAVERRPASACSIHAGCACGAVRFELPYATTELRHCHCSTCRALHGSPFVTWAPLTSPCWEETESASALRWFRSSPWARRASCGVCGSSILMAYDYGRYGEPGATWISAAAIDEADWTDAALGTLSVTHICVADKAPWHELPPDGFKQFPHASELTPAWACLKRSFESILWPLPCLARLPSAWYMLARAGVRQWRRGRGQVSPNTAEEEENDAGGATVPSSTAVVKFASARPAEVFLGIGHLGEAEHDDLDEPTGPSASSDDDSPSQCHSLSPMCCL